METVMFESVVLVSPHRTAKYNNNRASCFAPSADVLRMRRGPQTGSFETLQYVQYFVLIWRGHGNGNIGTLEHWNMGCVYRAHAFIWLCVLIGADWFFAPAQQRRVRNHVLASFNTRPATRNRHYRPHAVLPGPRPGRAARVRSIVFICDITCWLK